MQEFERDISRMTNSLKRQNELNRRNSLVASFVTIMRYNGASEQSIQKALPGLHEFAKYAKKWPAHRDLDEPEDP